MVLQVRISTSARGTLKYFRESLIVGDYLSADAVTASTWQGEAAKRLGIHDEVVTDNAFAAVIVGADPRHLAQDFKKRLNDFRYGRTEKLELHRQERLIQRVKSNRTPGIEFTFSMPKGASLLYATGDMQVLEAFQAAIQATMREVERHAQTRVRTGGRNDNRHTHNLLWAGFTHETSRPVLNPDGDVTVDPHLHCHVYVPNLTYDEAEQRWKSTKFRGLSFRADYFQSFFEAHAAREMQKRGFEVSRRGTTWEVVQITPELAAQFSRRTQQVEDRARELGITSDKVKGELAAQTRVEKDLGKDVDWRDQTDQRLGPQTFRKLRTLSKTAETRGPQPRLSAEERAEAAEEAVEWALQRRLEQRSTTTDHAIKGDAMRYTAGVCLPEDIDRAYAARAALVAGHVDDIGQRRVTTEALVIEERHMLKLVRDGQNEHTTPLVPAPRISKALYTAFKEGPEQLAACLHVFSSRDFVTLIRGQAGTGKSFLLTEFTRELGRHGIHPVALAPTAAASRGALREAGLEDANTLAKFLGPSEEGKTLRAQAKGGLIILDEAGIASVPQMRRLLKTAKDLNARVLLVGDTRQLTSVERGDALRLLEEKAGLVPAELTHIRRQTEPRYRKIVQKMAQGKTVDALKLADAVGFVQERERDDIPKAIAQLVAEHRENGKSVMVVSPIHAEGRVVSDAIRAELQARKLVGKDKATVSVLRQINHVQADLRDAPYTLMPDDIAVMRRDDRERKLAAGERLVAKMDKRGEVHLHRETESGKAGRRVAAGLHPQAFAVYRQHEIPLAVGDTVRALEAMEDNGVMRGDVATVKTINRRQKTLTLEIGKKEAVVPLDSQKLDHGYYSTPHGAQGLSVDASIVLANGHALRALPREALYVAISRGREKLTIFTDSKAQLAEHAKHSLAQTFAVDVAGQAFWEKRHREIVREAEDHADEAKSNKPGWKAWVVDRARQIMGQSQTSATDHGTSDQQRKTAIEQAAWKQVREEKRAAAAKARSKARIADQHEALGERIAQRAQAARKAARPTPALVTATGKLNPKAEADTGIDAGD